jgi:hypothetical protein
MGNHGGDDHQSWGGDKKDLRGGIFRALVEERDGTRVTGLTSLLVQRGMQLRTAA